MALVLSLTNFDDKLSTLPFQPVFLNEFNVQIVEDKKKLNGFITSVYQGDTLDITPQCSCGRVRGGEYIGEACPNCRSEVSYPAEQDIQSTVWARVPDKVEGFINPQMFIVLSAAFNPTGFDAMAWIIDTSYRHISKKIIPFKSYLEQQFEQYGIKRGLNNFIRNFDTIMEIIFNSPTYKAPKHKETMDALRTYIATHRGAFFTQHISFPSSTMFVIESTATGRYADPKIEGAIDAIGVLNAIYHPTTPMSERKKENWVAKVIIRLAAYYVSLYKDTIGRKKGLVRKHILGTLHPFTTRTVITSRTANHNYDELEFPWGPAILTFKEHLQSKLLHRGFSPQEARQYLAEHVHVFSPLLKEIFAELINDAQLVYGKPGIPGNFVRNPSLDRGSNQFLKIIKVKDDPRDNTISLSVLVLRGLISPVTLVIASRRTL